MSNWYICERGHFLGGTKVEAGDFCRQNDTGERVQIAGIDGLHITYVDRCGNHTPTTFSEFARTYVWHCQRIVGYKRDGLSKDAPLAPNYATFDS
jgi:hypothetical protein